MSTARRSAVPDAHLSADVGAANAPSIAPPTTRPHIAKRQEARRRQVLDTAAQLFFTKGYAGMTMSSLCNALGVTKPAMYYYFTDKYEIFDILCREAVQICLSAVRETASPTLSMQEHLQACLLKMARRCINRHYAAALTYRSRQYLYLETMEWLHDMSRGYYHDLYALLDEGKHAGVFDFGDTRIATHSIGGIMDFIYIWHGPSRTDAQALAIELLDAVMKTILPATPNSAAKPAP